MKSKKDAKLSIKKIEDLIASNLGAAVQTLVAGLKANDEDGYPDWQTRVVCAKALINKHIPDVQRVTVKGEGENGSILVEIVKHYDRTPDKD